jgi:general secretion pathway protein D
MNISKLFPFFGILIVGTLSFMICSQTPKPTQVPKASKATQAKHKKAQATKAQDPEATPSSKLTQVPKASKVTKAEHKEAQATKAQDPEATPSSKPTQVPKASEVTQAKRKEVQAIKAQGTEQVPFSFENKPLIDIVNFLAEKKGVNVVLPQLKVDIDQLRQQTVTYQPIGKETLSLDKAWDLLHTFIELSGFSLFEKKNDLYGIVKTGTRPEDAGGVTHQTLPLFINTHPDELPRSQERIRYITYLRNLRVPLGREDRENPISQIFAEMLSPNAIPIYEPKSNAIIIVDRANVIASVMHIINELDATGFKEAIEVVRLNNIPAREAVRVFTLLKKAAGEEEAKKLTPFIRAEQRAEGLSYFAADTRVIADDRTNSLIIMGRESAVSRISEFIRDNMDVTPESGRSILHTYDLQYLNAKAFEPVLQEIVKPLFAAAGPGQTTQGPGGGPERFFQGVIVRAEEVQEIEVGTLPPGRIQTEEIQLEATKATLENAGIKGKIVTGGNRLVVAALQDDWVRIKEMIERLDKPEPQVILEVMIADISHSVEKVLGSTTRNPTSIALPNQGFSFISSQLSVIPNVLGNSPTTLAQDLLKLISAGTENPPPITSLLPIGSTIISFNDPTTPGIFALLEILQTQTDIKILTHPYLIATNNQKATITSQELRRARGDAVPSASGVIAIQIEDVPATIQVQMIPRLSSLDRLSLQVAVDINQFLASAGFTRITRRVNTNANLSSGQVLVIGGLTRVDTSDIVTQTPFFGDIPIIGYLFKRTSKVETKTNLVIFIAPTIVEPKLRGGLNLYTTDKIRKGRRDVDDTLIFGNNRDPITYLFFGKTQTSDQLVMDYLSHATNAPEFEQIQTTKEKRRLARHPIRPPRAQPKVPLPLKKETITEVIA